MAIPLKKSSSSDGKSAETPSAAEFDMSIQGSSTPIAELQDTIQAAVEKGFVETRSAYDKAGLIAKEAATALESSYSTATKGIIELNVKALQALRANAEADLDFIKSVVGAKSISEFAAMQSEHVAKQFEAISDQAKAIAGLTQKVVKESAEPIKEQIASFERAA
jgi:phasin